MHEIEVECLPRHLPERLDVDIENLGVGQSLHVSDIVVPEGVRVVTSREQVVALIAHKIDEVDEADEEMVDEELEAADEEDADEA